MADDLTWLRVQRTGFADASDRERSDAVQRQRRFCGTCDEVTMHRDGLEVLGIAEMSCLRCLFRPKG